MTRSPTAVPCPSCGGEGCIGGTFVTCETCARTGFVEPDEPPTRCAFCDEEPAGGDGFCSDECARGADNEVGVDQSVHEDLEYEAPLFV